MCSISRLAPYAVDRTLYLEGRAGVQLIGEAPGTVVIQWDDPSNNGAGPDDVRVLFHAEGNRDTTYRNLIWDGGCKDPQSRDNTCFVVAFDQSFCGVCSGPEGRCLPADERTEPGLCDGLPWPESPTIGHGDMAGAHIDSSFRNAHIGLRIGHYQVQDDTLTVRRCRFTRNFAGASIEDFNALRIWFWDDWFEDNYVGVTNDIQWTRRRYDPDYKTGRCDQPAGEACYRPH